MNKRNIYIHFTVLMLASIISAVIIYQGGATFDRSDDAGIVSILRGSNGLQPSPDGVFISHISGYILFYLYKISESVPWYSIQIYCYLLVSLYLTVFICYRAINKIVLRFVFLACSLLYFYAIARSVSFTAASLTLTCISCAFFIFYLLNEEHYENSHAVVCGVFVALAYLLRPSMLVVSLIVLILTAKFCLLYGSRKISLAFFSPLLIVIIVNSAIAYKHGQQKDVIDYNEFNKARSIFHDTRIAEWKSSTSGGTETNLAWDYADYTVAKNWWIYDAKIYNVDSFSKSTNDSEMSNLFSVDEFRQSLNNVKYFALISMCVILLFACYDHKTHISRKFSNKLILFSFVITLLPLFALMFIRFPQRVALPMLLFCTLFFSVVVKKINADLVVLRNFIAFLSIIVVFVCGYYISADIKADIEYRYAERNYFNGCMKIIVGYFDKNTVFVLKSPNRFPDISAPFTEDNGFGGLKILPCGWLTGSPLYYRFLIDNNFTDVQRIVPDMIANERVVLLFWDTPGYWNVYKPIFLSHLRRHYAKEGSPPISIHEVLDLRVNGYGLLAMQLIGND